MLTVERMDRVSPVLAALAEEPSIAAADPVGVRLPIVLDTPDKATDKRVWDWLSSLPGVIGVDVAFISWDAASAPLLSLPVEQPR